MPRQLPWVMLVLVLLTSLVVAINQENKRRQARFEAVFQECKLSGGRVFVVIGSGSMTCTFNPQDNLEKFDER